MRLHKPADKKIKNRERRTDDRKKGSKEREGKRVFIQDIYKAIRWAYKRAGESRRATPLRTSQKAYLVPHFPFAFDPWKRRLFHTKEKRIARVRERQKTERERERVPTTRRRLASSRM